jgi:hypothetical protein
MVPSKYYGQEIHEIHEINYRTCCSSYESAVKKARRPLKKMAEEESKKGKKEVEALTSITSEKRPASISWRAFFV